MAHQPEYYYYQLGGFEPHIRLIPSTYDDKVLAEAIVGTGSPLRAGKKLDEPVDLILGIKPHGSSHLLLTRQQAQSFKRDSTLSYSQSRFYVAEDFESLSPISFSSVEELGKKLSFLKPKARGKKSGSGAPGDSSQANRGYMVGTQIPYRGTFEHGRVLFRILNDSLRSAPGVYGCSNTSWTKELCISSFVFNTKGVDDRPSSERTRNPHVLDIGFCNAVFPEVIPEYGTATHIVHAGNAILGKKGVKQPFTHGTTDTISASMLPDRIQDLFKGCKVPTILLVNKEEETKNFLRNMGVDISQWKDGLKELVVTSPTSKNPSSSSRNYNNLPRHHRSSSRSRSPSRRGYETNNAKYPSNHQDSCNNTRRPPSFAPVYVLDMQQLYTALMHDVQGAPNVVDIAEHLGLLVDSGWCAGNEAPLLIDIWRSMISGLPIDDQRELRMGGGTAPDSAAADPVPGPSTAPSSGGLQHLQSAAGASDSEDSEEDPNAYNDKVQNQSQAQKAPEAPAKPAAYGDWDQSDYGSDSDESD